MVKPLPERKKDSITGSQFMVELEKIYGPKYEEAVIREVLAGNVPDFIRPENWKEIKIKEKIGGLFVTMTIRVAPDYLAIGSNDDYVRVPLSPIGLQTLLSQMDAALPTKKIVDIIDKEAHDGLLKLVDAKAVSKRSGIPLDKGTTYMIKPDFTWSASILADELISGKKLPKMSLVSGHKKDVIVHPVPIEAKRNLIQYRPNHPQGLDFLNHFKDHTDYSLGARLVDSVVRVQITGEREVDKNMKYSDIIMDPQLFRLLSHVKFDITKVYAGLVKRTESNQITV